MFDHAGGVTCDVASGVTSPWPHLAEPFSVLIDVVVMPFFGIAEIGLFSVRKLVGGTSSGH
ncbi:MAG: hypothetical protein WAL90_15660 [Desulfobacterales bacterium]